MMGLCSQCGVMLSGVASVPEAGPVAPQVAAATAARELVSLLDTAMLHLIAAHPPAGSHIQETMARAGHLDAAKFLQSQDPRFNEALREQRAALDARLNEQLSGGVVLQS